MWLAGPSGGGFTCAHGARLTIHILCIEKLLRPLLKQFLTRYIEDQDSKAHFVRAGDGKASVLRIVDAVAKGKSSA